METLAWSQFEFFVIFLILNWTNEGFHHMFLHQVRQLPTPTTPSDNEYYSATTVFDDKTPDQLSYQMDTLLSRLYWLSDGGKTPLSLPPSPDFTPLQNVCLYMKAFGINETPLGAFQPLDTVKLTRAFQMVWPSVDQITVSSQIQMWDRYLRYHLPIDCPQNNEILTPNFTAILDRMNATDRETVRLGIEQICEQFPSFRKPEYRDLVQLHQCYHSSEDDEVFAMLQEWLKTGDGEHVKLQIFMIFQTSLAPEELALTLTDMLILWCLDEPDDEDESLSTPANLIGLGRLLTTPEALKQSHTLLLELFRSFCQAVKDLKIPIMHFLKRAADVDSNIPPSEDLYVYNVQRLQRKSDSEAISVSNTDLDQVLQKLSLL